MDTTAVSKVTSGDILCALRVALSVRAFDCTSADVMFPGCWEDARRRLCRIVEYSFGVITVVARGGVLDLVGRPGGR